MVSITGALPTAALQAHVHLIEHPASLYCARVCGSLSLCMCVCVCVCVTLSLSLFLFLCVCVCVFCLH